MNCEQTRPILMEYVLEENGLPAAERGEISRHLESCDACSKEAARLRQTTELLVRGEAAEEVSRHIRLVAEPVSFWQAFWRDGARVAFAGAALLAVAVVSLALFRTTVSYSQGGFEIAFGTRPAAPILPPAVPPTAPPTAPTVQPAALSQSLDRAQIERLIAEAVAASEAKQQAQSSELVKAAAKQAEDKRQGDQREMSANLHYFQDTQTMMWKDQIQNQQLVSALARQAGLGSETH